LIEVFAQSHFITVIPAQAGIQGVQKHLDTCFRRYDNRIGQQEKVIKWLVGLKKGIEIGLI
jgi:hypothetical protein